MSTEAKFVDGMRVYNPHEKAPDFVVAEIVIEHDDFVDWMADRGDKIRITIKRSRGGKPSGESKPSRAPVKDCPQPDQGGFADDDLDSIPF